MLLLTRHFTILVLLLFAISINSNGQNQEELGNDFDCECTHSKKYYKSRPQYSWTHPSIRKAKNFHKQFDWFSIGEAESVTPFVSVWDDSHYNDSLDNLFYGNPDLDMYNRTDIIFSDKIGPVVKTFIIRSEKKNDTIIILQEELMFSEFSNGHSDITMTVSLDSGLTWNSYPTGLCQNLYYHFKRKSEVNIFKNDSIIQFEVALLIQTAPTGHLAIPEYELVQDNLIIEFDLHKIMMDSDQDGLSDIKERIFNTDRFCEDTDGDGITDLYDSNPKYPCDTSEMVMIYEFVLSGKAGHMFEQACFDYNSMEKMCQEDNIKPKEHYFFVITDVPEIQRVSSEQSQYIILNYNELKEMQKWFPSVLNEYKISPLCECDNKENTFSIWYGNDSWSESYIVVRKNRKWNFYHESSIIQ